MGSSVPDPFQSQRLSAAGGIPSSEAMLAAQRSQLLNQGGQAGAQAPNTARSAAEIEEFWAKLDVLRKKYFEALRRIAPIAQYLVGGVAAQNKDTFKRQVQEVYAIFRMRRVDRMPQRLSINTLDKAERFVIFMIQQYNKYSKAKKEQLQAALPTAAHASSSASAAVRAVPVPGQSHARIPAQPRANVPAHASSNDLVAGQLARSVSAEQVQQALLHNQQLLRNSQVAAGRQKAGANLNRSQPPVRGQPRFVSSSGNLPLTQHQQLPQQQVLRASSAAAVAQAPSQSQSRRHPAVPSAQRNGHRAIAGVRKHQTIMNPPPGNGAAETKSSAAPKREPSVNAPAKAPVPGRTPARTTEEKLKALEAQCKKLADYFSHSEKVFMFRQGERIESTLESLRKDKDAARVKKKRYGSVENRASGNEAIKAETVFESTADGGSRLTKMAKTESDVAKSLKSVVEADCILAQTRNPLLSIDITEEFDQPVVTCQVLIEDIKLPKLRLRVQRGYPKRGTVSHSFERPPLGWVGVLETVRARFTNAIDAAPGTGISVATFLEAWGREAQAVVQADLRGHLGGDASTIVESVPVQ